MPAPTPPWFRGVAGLDPGSSLPLEVRSLNRADYCHALGAAISAAIFYMALILSSGNDAAAQSIGGVWFQSDGWRVFDDMTNFAANHHRDTVHPLFSISLIPFTQFLATIFGISMLQSIYVANCTFFALSTYMLFVIIRVLGCARIDAYLLCGIFITSSAAIFWFTVPETYPAGCAAILLCFLVMVTNPIKNRYYVAAAVLALGTTVTNWMAGVIVAASNRTVLRALTICVMSFVTTAMGAVAAKFIFPNPGSPFFLPKAVAGEETYMGHADSGSIFDRLGGELITPLIAPVHKHLYNQPTGVMNSFQSTIPATLAQMDVAYLGAITAATVLYSAAFIALFRNLDRFGAALMLVLLGQIVLHLAYGEETFLYSLHFAPLLVLLFSQAFRREPRSVLRLAALSLIGFGSWNNLHRFFTIIDQPFQGTAEYLYRLSL